MNKSFPDIAKLRALHFYHQESALPPILGNESLVN